ncbi:unnamed protein product [Protopolystoma xenopodis]|uniref:Uncharacterized protein n=1 Tax=Protopolystoma xenopodis TaxID=117903 RepID=A0A3S5A2W1_9PLAT|nr:unnamed protein product [Protopolystoma xenopodis]
MMLRIAILTDDADYEADYDADETSGNVPRLRSYSGNDNAYNGLRTRICYDDFCKHFTSLEVCHLGLESLERDSTVYGKRRLDEAFFVGEWKIGTSAGGCAKFMGESITNLEANPCKRIFFKIL